MDPLWWLTPLLVLQWLKAILEAAKGNTIDFGDVMIVLIGDPFQLPAIGGASVYAGAAMLAALPGETPAATWQRLVTDVNRKRGGTLKCVRTIRLLCPRGSVASEFAAAGARLQEAL